MSWVAAAWPTLIGGLRGNRFADAGLWQRGTAELFFPGRNRHGDLAAGTSGDDATSAAASA